MSKLCVKIIQDEGKEARVKTVESEIDAFKLVNDLRDRGYYAWIERVNDEQDDNSTERKNSPSKRRK